MFYFWTIISIIASVMRKSAILSLLFAVFLLFGLVSCNGRNSSTEPGRIEFTTYKIDKGELPRGCTEKYEFEYKNVGKGPAQILGVSYMCGCTEAEYSTDILKPGKKGKLVVTFRSRHMAAGPFSKQVLIITNQAKEGPDKVITVAGTLVDSK